MKQFLAIIAFGAVLAAPAFAQQAPNVRQDAQALHARVHVYAAEYYEPRHEGQILNPDRQLGSNRF
jgi:hypothetical protein